MYHFLITSITSVYHISVQLSDIIQFTVYSNETKNHNIYCVRNIISRLKFCKFFMQMWKTKKINAIHMIHMQFLWFCKKCHFILFRSLTYNNFVLVFCIFLFNNTFLPKSFIAFLVSHLAAAPQQVPYFRN